MSGGLIFLIFVLAYVICMMITLYVVVRYDEILFENPKKQDMGDLMVGAIFWPLLLPVAIAELHKHEKKQLEDKGKEEE